MEEIVGTTDKTVQSVRKEFLQRAEIPRVKAYRGKDGKVYSVTRVYSDKPKQANRARAALATLDEDAPRKAVSLKQLEREAKKKERQKVARNRYRKPDDSAPIRLYHSDFRDLEEIAMIEPGSVDLVSETRFVVGNTGQNNLIRRPTALLYAHEVLAPRIRGIRSASSCERCLQKSSRRSPELRHTSESSLDPRFQIHPC